MEKDTNSHQETSVGTSGIPEEEISKHGNSVPPQGKIRDWIIALVCAILVLPLAPGVESLVRSYQPHQIFITASPQGVTFPKVRVVVGDERIGVTDASGRLECGKKTSGPCHLFDAETNEPLEIRIDVGGKIVWRQTINIDEDRSTIPLIVRRSIISTQ